MTSFGKWLMAGLSPLLLVARAEAAPVSRNLAARVSARLADLWNVPAGEIRLAWGRSTDAHAPDDDSPFRIVGAGAGGWHVVVFHPAESTAVAVRLRAGVERPVMVAARSLASGARIVEGDLREEVRVHWGEPKPDSALVPSLGWEVRRPIRAGDLVAVPSVAPPPFVVAGEPVRLEWESGGVQVSVMGIALNSARRGEVVRARLEERPARLSGTVTAPGIAVLASGGGR